MASASAMLRKLRGRDPQDWLDAVSIGHSGIAWTPRAVAGVAAILRDGGDPRQRTEAAYLLGRASEFPAAGEALFQALTREAEKPEVRGMAAEQVAWCHPNRIKLIAAYLRGTRHPSPILRFWCVYGLMCLKAKGARRRLQELAATDHEQCPGWSTVSTEAKLALARFDGLPDWERLSPGPFHKAPQLPSPSPTAFLRRAIELASTNARERHGGPFGAVIVRGKEIVAEGVNRVVLFHDPTAHAEIVAIREACRLLQAFDLTGCEIYCSCEPNPMALGAIYWARLSRIHYAASREDAAKAGFDDLYLYAEVAKPIAERSLPTRNLLRRRGRAPFEAWAKSASKIRY